MKKKENFHKSVKKPALSREMYSSDVSSLSYALHLSEIYLKEFVTFFLEC